jgi:hypothetical protein
LRTCGDPVAGLCARRQLRRRLMGDDGLGYYRTTYYQSLGGQDKIP